MILKNNFTKKENFMCREIINPSDKPVVFEDFLRIVIAPNQRLLIILESDNE